MVHHNNEFPSLPFQVLQRYLTSAINCLINEIALNSEQGGIRGNSTSPKNNDKRKKQEVKRKGKFKKEKNMTGRK